MAPAMAALSLAGSREQFSMWLLQNVGIEGNDFTVNEARATARNGDAWKDCCAAWQGKCALPPDDDARAAAGVGMARASVPCGAGAPRCLGK